VPLQEVRRNGPRVALEGLTMELAPAQRLAIWAKHQKPKAYAGSDMMRDDLLALLAEVDRMAELLYNLHIKPDAKAGEGMK